MSKKSVLTHWGRVTHICVGKLTIIGSDNGLSSGRRQGIIWTNAAILLIGPLGTNFSEILNKIQIFSLKKIRLNMSSAKCCPFHLGLNVLRNRLFFKECPSILFLGCWQGNQTYWVLLSLQLYVTINSSIIRTDMDMVFTVWSILHYYYALVLWF